MKKLITLFATMIFASSLAFAEVEPSSVQAENLAADCSKQADAQQPQDRDAFVNECMNEKLGYEKDE